MIYNILYVHTYTSQNPPESNQQFHVTEEISMGRNIWLVGVGGRGKILIESITWLLISLCQTDPVEYL